MNLGQSELGYGRFFSFTLSNPSDRLAVVKRIYLLVEKIEKDLVGGLEGQFSEYRYEVVLSPNQTGIYEVAQDLKYAPGEVDRISIDVKTQEFGYRYLFRIYVEWYDSIDGSVKTIQTEILTARFPMTHAPSKSTEFLSPISKTTAMGLISIFEQKPELLLKDPTIQKNPILLDLFTQNHEFWEDNPHVFLFLYKNSELFLALAKSCDFKLESIKKRVENTLESMKKRMESPDGT